MAYTSPTDMGDRRNAIVGVLLIALAAFSYGTIAIWAKVAFSRGASPLPLLFWRFLGASIIFWIFCFFRQRSLRRPSRIVVGAVFAGVVGFGFASIGFYFSLTLIDAALAALILYVYPTITNVAATLLFGEPFSKRRASALFISFAGVALILGTGTMQISSGPLLLGAAAAIGAALLYSAFSLASQILLSSMPRLLLSAYVSTGALLTMSIMNAGIPPLGPDPVVLAMIAAMIAATVFGFAFYFSGIRLLGAARASVVMTMEPLATAALAITLLGEWLSGVQLLGATLIIGGVLLSESDTIRSTSTPVEQHIRPC